MRICYDGRIFEQQRAGGISRVFAELIPRIDREPGSEAAILTSGRMISQYDMVERVRCVKIPDVRRLIRPRRYFSRVHDSLDIWLRSLVARTGFDLWHSTEYSVPVFNMPAVVTIHDMIPELFPDHVDESYRRYAVAAKRRAVSRCAAVITVSETTRTDLLDWYKDLDESKVTAIPNGYDSGVFRAHELPRERILLYIGRRARYKGFDMLIDGLNHWKEMGDFQLLIVGSELTPAERSRCRFDVTTLSNVSDDRLARLYSTAAAFLFPSRYEGFGLPILEAMASDCPIVATEIPATREIAGAVPYYFDIDDLCGFTHALDAAVTRTAWAGRSITARERLARYSWDRTASMTADVYRRLYE